MQGSHLKNMESWNIKTYMYVLEIENKRNVKDDGEKGGS